MSESRREQDVSSVDREASGAQVSSRRHVPGASPASGPASSSTRLNVSLVLVSTLVVVSGLVVCGNATPLPSGTETATGVTLPELGPAIGVLVVLTLVVVVAVIRYRKRIWASCRKMRSSTSLIFRDLASLFWKNEKAFVGSSMVVSLIWWNILLATESMSSSWSLVQVAMFPILRSMETKTRHRISSDWFISTAIFMTRSSRSLEHREG